MNDAAEASRLPQQSSPATPEHASNPNAITGRSLAPGHKAHSPPDLPLAANAALAGRKYACGFPLTHCPDGPENTQIEFWLPNLEPPGASPPPPPKHLPAGRGGSPHGVGPAVVPLGGPPLY